MLLSPNAGGAILTSDFFLARTERKIVTSKTARFILTYSAFRPTCTSCWCESMTLGLSACTAAGGTSGGFGASGWIPVTVLQFCSFAAIMTTTAIYFTVTDVYTFALTSSGFFGFPRSPVVMVTSGVCEDHCRNCQRDQEQNDKTNFFMV